MFSLIWWILAAPVLESYRCDLLAGPRAIVSGIGAGGRSGRDDRDPKVGPTDQGQALWDAWEPP